MDDTIARDEELPGRPPTSPRRRQLLITAAAVLVLGLAALAITRVAGHSNPDAGPATVTVQPTSITPTTPDRQRSDSAPPGLTKPPAVLHGLGHLSSAAIAAAHAECPRLAPTCVTTGETPSQVRAALRRTYPGLRDFVAVSDIAYSTTSGPRLVYRLLSARAGRRVIVVEIRQTQSGDGIGAQKIFNDTEYVYRTQTLAGRLTVELQISVPPNVYLHRAPMTELVGDAALLSTG